MKKYIVKIEKSQPDPRTTPRNPTATEQEYSISAHKDFNYQDRDVQFHVAASKLEAVKRYLTAKAAMLGGDIEFILAEGVPNEHA